MKESQDNTVHLLYKKLGQTPLQCVRDFKAQHPDLLDTPMTYAGRLDPMAEGLLVVLSGEAVHRKGEFTELSKTYIADVLWGFETDTHDILGMIAGGNVDNLPSMDAVKNILQTYVGKREQKYPAYSSQTVGGKSLIEWSREGRIGEVVIPSHEVEMMSGSVISRRYVSGAELLEIIQERIGLVQGDFRQEMIVRRWQEVLEGNVSVQFPIDTITIDVSGGFYVRQLVADMAQALGTHATTFHIKRIQVGDYVL
jgi:tRNA pseudouridine(55) synthase